VNELWLSIESIDLSETLLCIDLKCTPPKISASIVLDRWSRFKQMIPVEQGLLVINNGQVEIFDPTTASILLPTVQLDSKVYKMASRFDRVYAMVCRYYQVSIEEYNILDRKRTRSFPLQFEQMCDDVCDMTCDPTGHYVYISRAQNLSHGNFLYLSVYILDIFTGQIVRKTYLGPWIIDQMYILQDSTTSPHKIIIGNNSICVV
jgi:hypothetical protein